MTHLNLNPSMIWVQLTAKLGFLINAVCITHKEKSPTEFNNSCWPRKLLRLSLLFARVNGISHELWTWNWLITTGVLPLAGKSCIICHWESASCSMRPSSDHLGLRIYRTGGRKGTVWQAPALHLVVTDMKLLYIFVLDGWIRNLEVNIRQRITLVLSHLLDSSTSFPASVLTRIWSPWWRIPWKLPNSILGTQAQSVLVNLW